MLSRAPLIFAIGLVFVGCAVSDRDVSHDPTFLVGYQPGQLYRLVKPVYLLQIDAGHGELLPPDEKRDYGSLSGLLPAGTAIRILSLSHHVAAAPVQWETGVTTHAELVGRPGCDIALNDISAVRWVDGDCHMKTGVLCPDPEWVKLDPSVRLETSQ